MKLDRKRFFKSYRDAFGPIASPKTVAGLNAILDKLETETRIPTLDATAYVLATAKHESGHSENGTWVEFVPVKEIKASKTKNPGIWKLQQRYWPSGYFGRGLVQTTWEENYRKIGNRLGVGEMFVQKPDLLLESQWAYEALVIGMVYGLYRPPHKLSKYFTATKSDHYNAREIVNGDLKKNGQKIAREAQLIAGALRASLVADTVGDQLEVSDTGRGAAEGPVPLPDTTDKPTSPVITTPVVEVEQSAPAKEEKQEVSGIRTHWAAITGFLTTSGAGIVSWIGGARTELIYGFFGAAAVIATAYMVTRAWGSNKEKQRQHDLILLRETQAYELTKLQAQSAMNDKLTTISIVPKPLQSSDSK